jgi:hypothetical protein
MQEWNWSSEQDQKTSWIILSKWRLENIEKIATKSTKKANKAQLMTQRFEDPLPGTAKRRQQHLKGNLHREKEQNQVQEWDTSKKHMVY